MREGELKELVGREISTIEGLFNGSTEVKITFVCGSTLSFFHEQDCCEDVDLDDFDEDWYDCVGCDLVSVEEVWGQPEALAGGDSSWESETWTFYRVETTGGGVFLRWIGSSNGYYSEAVDIEVFINE